MSSLTGRGTASRRRWWWVLGAGVGAGVVFVLVWFQPQKLVIDERVDETIPVVTAPPTTGADAEGDPAVDPPASTEPVELARGELQSLDHGTSGVARVLELTDGSRIVRLEELDTSNGPDLFVYLTANPTDGEEGAFDDDYVDLGRLKGNQGNQTYDVPADLDLAHHGTVVIWCDRFDSAFGAADLQPV
jgi:hypothetical protein